MGESLEMAARRRSTTLTEASRRVARSIEKEAPPVTVKPILDGYHEVTPYLMVDGAETLLEFVKKAFDAEETWE
jgi:hypothetical protein